MTNFTDVQFLHDVLKFLQLHELQFDHDGILRYVKNDGRRWYGRNAFFAWQNGRWRWFWRTQHCRYVNSFLIGNWNMNGNGNGNGDGNGNWNRNGNGNGNCQIDAHRYLKLFFVNTTFCPPFGELCTTAGNFFYSITVMTLLHQKWWKKTAELEDPLYYKDCNQSARYMLTFFYDRKV